MSDRIAVMREGAILQVGHAGRDLPQPAHRFVAEFIGDPPINMLPAEVQARWKQLLARLPGDWTIPLGRRRAGGGRIPPRHPPARSGADAPRPDRAPSAGTVRFLENLGAEHVLHVEYGGTLVRVLTARRARPRSASRASSAAMLAEPSLRSGSGAKVPRARAGSAPHERAGGPRSRQDASARRARSTASSFAVPAGRILHHRRPDQCRQVDAAQDHRRPARARPRRHLHLRPPM